MDYNITRRSFGQILGGVVLSGSSLIHSAITIPAGAPIETSESAIFPYGTRVYREPYLLLELLRSEMALLKKMGFTMIKILES